ncbi:MAG: Ig-like domain-containing protein, partial [Lachnospiraceae bacterium]|nr:Ig-like domain-containing protein [Lachnospiraceae bacterium]
MKKRKLSAWLLSLTLAIGCLLPGVQAQAAGNASQAEVIEAERDRGTSELPKEKAGMSGQETHGEKDGISSAESDAAQEDKETILERSIESAGKAADSVSEEAADIVAENANKTAENPSRESPENANRMGENLSEETSVPTEKVSEAAEEVSEAAENPLKEDSELAEKSNGNFSEEASTSIEESADSVSEDAAAASELKIFLTKDDKRVNGETIMMVPGAEFGMDVELDPADTDTDKLWIKWHSNEIGKYEVEEGAGGVLLSVFNSGMSRYWYDYHHTHWSMISANSAGRYNVRVEPMYDAEGEDVKTTGDECFFQVRHLTDSDVDVKIYKTDTAVYRRDEYGWVTELDYTVDQETYNAQPNAEVIEAGETAEVYAGETLRLTAGDYPQGLVWGHGYHLTETALDRGFGYNVDFRWAFAGDMPEGVLDGDPTENLKEYEAHNQNIEIKTLEGIEEDQVFPITVYSHIVKKSQSNTLIEEHTYQKTIQVKVKAWKGEAEELALKESVSLYPGQEITLRDLAAEDSLLKTVPAGAKVDYSVSDPKVAAVEKGVLKGISAGETVLTVTSGSLSKECAVQVLETPFNLTLQHEDDYYIWEKDGHLYIQMVNWSSSMGGFDFNAAVSRKDGSALPEGASITYSWELDSSKYVRIIGSSDYIDEQDGLQKGDVRINGILYDETEGMVLGVKAIVRDSEGSIIGIAEAKTAPIYVKGYAIEPGLFRVRFLDQRSREWEGQESDNWLEGTYHYVTSYYTNKGPFVLNAELKANPYATIDVDVNSYDISYKWSVENEDGSLLSYADNAGDMTGTELIVTPDPEKDSGKAKFTLEITLKKEGQEYVYTKYMDMTLSRFVKTAPIEEIYIATLVIGGKKTIPQNYRLLFPLTLYPDEADDSGITWESSDSSIVSIEEAPGTKATVYLVSKEKTGTAKITARAGSHTVSVDIIVSDKPLALDKHELKLANVAGASGTLTVSIIDTINVSSLKWEVTSGQGIVSLAVNPSDSKICAVTPKEIGEAVVSVSSPEGFSDTCRVTVDYLVPELWGEVDPRDYALWGGNPYTVKEELWVGNLPTAKSISGQTFTGALFAGVKVTFDTDDLRVYYGKTRLKLKTNYTVSYANNQNAYTGSLAGTEQELKKAKAPKVTVKGKGKVANEAGETVKLSGSKILYFNIYPADVSEALMTSEPVLTGKAASKYHPKPTLTWVKSDGKTMKLAEKKQFTLEYYRWDSENNVKGEQVGNYLNETGEYLIKITGTGNFTGQVPDGGCPHVVVLDGKDKTSVQMSKVKVSGKYNQQAFNNGAAYDPAQGSLNMGTVVKQLFEKGDCLVKSGKTELKYGVDYEIEDFSADPDVNHEPGKGKVVLKGLGNTANGAFYGTKTLTFTIQGSAVKKVFNLASSIPYTGEPIYKDTGSPSADLENALKKVFKQQSNVSAKE